MFLKYLYASIDGFDLTSVFKSGSHDVILHRKVLPPGECTRSVRQVLCSSVHMCQFLIYSTFVGLLVWLSYFHEYTT